jgi:predicted choloylglycine hydrolase
MEQDRNAKPDFDLRTLPEWVKSLGLPDVAVEAIDRYWKPVWDWLEEELPLLPVHPERAQTPEAAAQEIHFEAVEESEPGAKWQASFEQMWPAYREWYLREGDSARPDLKTCQEMLRRHMPELFPTYERLVEFAGGDELAARCLSLYRPPHILVGCSQGAWTHEEPVLVRNYDYPASRIEGIIYSTACGERRVIGVRDCLWGLLDGMNDAGLAISLTFGGRKVVGDGFSIPLVVRYLLEVCDTVAEAREKLARIPIHAAQNLTLLDRSGEFVTAYLGPDREPRFRDRPATTNHQDRDDWPEYAHAVRSVERERCVLELLDDAGITRERFVEAFLEPPLHKGDHSRGFATLYTAAYFPAEGRVEYRWPSFVWEQCFDNFKEGTRTVTIGAAPSGDESDRWVR